MIRSAALAIATLSFGCAATAPMLAEPRLVREGDVRFQLGAAAAAPVGGDIAAVNAGRQQIGSGDAPITNDAKTTREILPAVAVGFGPRPGVAPVVRATLSLTREIEANVHYSGRDAHVGGRYLVWESRSADAGAWTFSVGADGHVLLMGRPSDGYLNASSESVRGYGVAAPVLFGWQSDAGLLIGYVGALVGYERVTASVLYAPTAAGPSNGKDLVIGRVHVTGTVGVGVGFRRVRAIVELGMRRDFIDARLGDESQKVALISLTPAFAIGINF